MSKKLSGVIAAISTPIQDDGAPDTARAVKLARFLLDNGCNGLNVLGTTGEATSFSLEERKRVMTAYKEAGLPMDRLMVGTGAAAVADAVANVTSLNPRGDILVFLPGEREIRETEHRSIIIVCRTTASSPTSKRW